MTLKPWRTTASQYLIEDEWICLRSDNCVTPSGSPVQPYYVLEYPPWVTIVPVTKAGELVLVRQYRHAMGEILLELPGGGFEAEDGTSIAAAERELAEETGYTGKDFREIAQFAPNPASHTNVSHIVIGLDLERTAPQDLDDSEEIDVELMPLDQVISELAKGSFLHATHVAALYHGLAHLGLLK